MESSPTTLHTPRDLIEITDTKTAVEITAQAEVLLDHFAGYTKYLHGPANPYLARLRSVDSLALDAVVSFLCTWWSFSRRTPQILLHCAAAYPEQADRRLVMKNYQEEDGMVHAGDSPHYDLLVDLIGKLGSRLTVNPLAEELIVQFMRTLSGLTPARATGVIAGFEHPALDITAILMAVVQKGGFADLLETDLYLKIHVAVEPSHLIWSHGNSLRYMDMGEAEAAEVLAGFRGVMNFWTCFWDLAIAGLFEA